MQNLWDIYQALILVGATASSIANTLVLASSGRNGFDLSKEDDLEQPDGSVDVFLAIKSGVMALQSLVAMIVAMVHLATHACACDAPGYFLCVFLVYESVCWLGEHFEHDNFASNTFRCSKKFVLKVVGAGFLFLQLFYAMILAAPNFPTDASLPFCFYRPDSRLFVLAVGFVGIPFLLVAVFVEYVANASMRRRFYALMSTEEQDHHAVAEPVIQDHRQMAEQARRSKRNMQRDMVRRLETRRTLYRRSATALLLLRFLGVACLWTATSSDAWPLAVLGASSVVCWLGSAILATVRYQRHREYVSSVAIGCCSRSRPRIHPREEFDAVNKMLLAPEVSVSLSMSGVAAFTPQQLAEFGNYTSYTKDDVVVRLSEDRNLFQIPDATLNQLVRNPHTCAIVLELVGEQQAPEGIRFIQAVQDYEREFAQEAKTHVGTGRTTAERIVNEYIAQDANSQINISGQLRNAVINSIRKTRLNGKEFEEACGSVVCETLGDLLSRVSAHPGLQSACTKIVQDVLKSSSEIIDSYLDMETND